MSDYSICFLLTEPQRYDKESYSPEPEPETRKRDRSKTRTRNRSSSHIRTHAGMVGLKIGSVLMKFWRRQQKGL